MPNKPTSIQVLLISASLLGAWMAIDGLSGRMFGTFLPFSNLWRGALLGAGINPQLLAWPLIVVGCAWSGAISAVFYHFTWAAKTTRLLAILSLFYLGPGTLLAAIVLLMLSTAGARRWLAQAPLDA